MLRLTKVVLFLLTLGVLLPGCNDKSVNDNDPSATAALTLRLTDSPGDLDEMHLTISDLSVYYNREWLTVSDRAQTVNLLEWSNGRSLVVGSADLPAGDYHRLRIRISTAQVVVKGQTHTMQLSNATQLGNEIIISESLEAGKAAELVIDFDVARSVIRTGSPGSFGYRLEPVLRVISGEVSASIAGEVVNPEAVAIAYAISGTDTITSAIVDRATGEFKLAFLPAGGYSIALQDTMGAAYLQGGIQLADGQDLTVGTIMLETTGSGPVCGNGQCEPGENETNCPQDCGNTGGPVCGNGICESGEDENNCPGDCGNTGGPVCGNGICEEGEDATNCQGDCGNNSSNEHFEFERNKPGVVASVGWRSNTEIIADHHGNDEPGDPAFPVYDPVADAARLAIMNGEDLSQLRHEFPFTAGSVWSQYEIMLDPVLFTAPYDPYGMKLWRWEDSNGAECNDERRLTMNIGFDPAPHVYHRDGCPIPGGEVRVLMNDGVYDEQPGGETQCRWGEFQPHPQCFRWAPGVWLRLTYHFDFSGKVLHIWARRMDENIPRKIVEFAVPDWNSNYGFDTSGAWLHSTSRTHGNWANNLPDAYIWARNLILSTQPITP